ncbi:MAG: ABC transporter permease [Gammaproteobacteria bacterium]|nr:ABC transporter permease [Gammaproteobacteria bacterium]
MMADTWHLFNKYMIITLRMPMWTLFTLIQPLIWLIIFGQLFGRFVQSEHYMDFMVPGILIMTVLFGSSWSGVSLLREISAGTVDKMLVSPVSRVAIVLSRVLHSAVQVIAQAIIILIVAWAMGSSINFNPIYLVLGMLVVFLLGVGFAALSNGFAITLQREEPLVMIGNMMTLPLMFFSSALVPEQFMPDWIQYASVLNPITYAVEAVRAVISSSPDLSLYVKGFVVMLVFAGATLAWAVTAFNALRD